jgi:hypothetical protein
MKCDPILTLERITPRKSGWRLEFRALPPGWGQKRLTDPGVFFRTHPRCIA